MRLFNEAAAGEFASHQARMKQDDLDRIKQRALSALRDGRFRDFDNLVSEYDEKGGIDDLESWACNIVSAELE